MAGGKRENMRESSEDDFFKVVETVIGNLTGETVDTANLMSLLKERADSREVAYNWYIEFILTTSYIIIAILGVIFNIFITFIILQSKKLLQNPSNILVINLMASDLLMAVFCVPFTLLSTIRRSYLFGPIMCKLIPFLQSTSILVCSFTITTIAIDRLIRITRNYQRSTYQVLFAKTHWWLITVETAAIWLISLSISFPVALYQKLIQVGHDNSLAFKKCIEHWPSETTKGYYTVLVMVNQFVFPTTVLIISHMVIGNKLNRNLSGLPDTNGNVNTNTNGNYETNEQSPTGSNERTSTINCPAVIRPKSSTGSVNSALSCLSLFNNKSSMRKSSFTSRQVQYSTVSCNKNGQGHTESLTNNNDSPRLIAVPKSFLRNNGDISSKMPIESNCIPDELIEGKETHDSLSNSSSPSSTITVHIDTGTNGPLVTQSHRRKSSLMDLKGGTLSGSQGAMASMTMALEGTNTERLKGRPSSVVEVKNDLNMRVAFVDDSTIDCFTSGQAKSCTIQLKSPPYNEKIKSPCNDPDGHFISRSTRASRDATTRDVSHPNSPNSVELEVTHEKSIGSEVSRILRQNATSLSMSSSDSRVLVVREKSILDTKIHLTDVSSLNCQKEIGQANEEAFVHEEEEDLQVPVKNSLALISNATTTNGSSVIVSVDESIFNCDSSQLLPNIKKDCISGCNVIVVEQTCGGGNSNFSLENVTGDQGHVTSTTTITTATTTTTTMANSSSKRLPIVKPKAIMYHRNSLTPTPSIVASNVNTITSVNEYNKSSTFNGNSSGHNNNATGINGIISSSMVHSPSLATTCMLSPGSASRRFNVDQRDILVRELRRNHQVTRVLLSITACFTITWLPWNVFNVYLDFNENTSLSIGLIYLIQAICLLIAMITIPLNAFWYGWSNPLIKSEGIHYLTSLYHKIQKYILQPITTLRSSETQVHD